MNIQPASFNPEFEWDASCFHTKDRLLSWVKGIVYENLQLGIPVYYGFLFVCFEL